MDYATQNKILESIKPTIDELDVWIRKKVENKILEKEIENKIKLENPCKYFGFELSNSINLLPNGKPYEDLFIDLVKYLFQYSPSHLYHKNKNKHLVYLLKTSYGEVEVNFGSTDFHNSEKTVHINFWVSVIDCLFIIKIIEKQVKNKRLNFILNFHNTLLSILHNLKQS